MTSHFALGLLVVAVFAATSTAHPMHEEEEVYRPVYSEADKENDMGGEEHMGYVINADGGSKGKDKYEEEEEEGKNGGDSMKEDKTEEGGMMKMMVEMMKKTSMMEGGSNEQFIEQACMKTLMSLQLVEEGKVPIGFVISTQDVLIRTRSIFFDIQTLSRFSMNSNQAPTEQDIDDVILILAKTLKGELAAVCDVEVSEEVFDSVLLIGDVLRSLSGVSQKVDEEMKEEEEEEKKGFPINKGSKPQVMQPKGKPDRFVMSPMKKDDDMQTGGKGRRGGRGQGQGNDDGDNDMGQTGGKKSFYER